MFDRQRKTGSRSRTGAERHRVEACHEGDAVGKVALDHARQEDIADGDGSARDEGGGKQHGHGIERPQTGSKHQQDKRPKQGPLGSMALSKRRRQRRKQPETQHRQRRQQAGARGGHAGFMHHLGQKHG